MALTTIPAAGAKIRGSVLSNLVTEVRPVVCYKSATTSRNNGGTGATLTADADLVLALVANSRYDFEFTILCSSAANAAGDLQFNFTYPSDATLSNGSWGLVNTLASGSSADVEAASGAQLDASTPSTAVSIGLSTTAASLYIRGTIVVVTAGNLTFVWAQQTANANNSSVLGGSFGRAMRAT